MQIFSRLATSLFENSKSSSSVRYIVGMELSLLFYKNRNVSLLEFVLERVDISVIRLFESARRYRPGKVSTFGRGPATQLFSKFSTCSY